MARGRVQVTSWLRAGRVQLAISSLSLALTACGYQFQVGGAGPVVGGAAPSQPAKADAPALRIGTFENKTFQPNLEHKYTTYARYEFAAASGAKVVTEPEPADYALKAQIVNVVIPSLTFTQADTFESRVTVTVKAVIEDLRTGQAVWHQQSTQSSEFFVTNDLQFNRVLQDRALEQAGEFIAQDLASRFLEYLRTGGAPAATPPGAPGPAPGGTK